MLRLIARRCMQPSNSFDPFGASSVLLCYNRYFESMCRMELSDGPPEQRYYPCTSQKFSEKHSPLRDSELHPEMHRTDVACANILFYPCILFHRDLTQGMVMSEILRLTSLIASGTPDVHENNDQREQHIIRADNDQTFL
jgi:hypothetical protein